MRVPSAAGRGRETLEDEADKTLGGTDRGQAAGGGGDAGGGAIRRAGGQALGVSEQTFNRWRTHFGGMKEGETRRLKELEIEDTRLKKAVADQPPVPPFTLHPSPFTAH